MQWTSSAAALAERPLWPASFRISIATTWLGWKAYARHCECFQIFAVAFLTATQRLLLGGDERTAAPP